MVFGAESVGKSSLLQRLSLLPFFPTDKAGDPRTPPLSRAPKNCINVLK